VDVLLATDLVAAAQPDALRRLSPMRTAAVINLAEMPTADMIRQRDMRLPMAEMLASIQRRSQEGRSHTLHAARLAEGLFGDTIAANVLMLGYAWQKGLLPLSHASLVHAIELNGAAVELNKRAFVWGRFIAIDGTAAERIAGLDNTRPVTPSLDQLVEKLASNLRDYQNDAFAERFLKLVEDARRAGRVAGDEGERFATAVAENAHRIMAYKDEYEVARLYVRPAFKAALHAQFSDLRRVSVWLAPPLLSRHDPSTGRPRKRRFGPWVFSLFALLSRFKFLRGTPLDPFGWAVERQMERRLARSYASLVDDLSTKLTAERLDASVALASAPAEIRGVGPVKALAYEQAMVRMDGLHAALN
jgi:indolepyruvate ferredoxin oxidoreductase